MFFEDSTLLETTISSIHQNGHTVEDIVFIGSSDGEYECSFEEFEMLANQYDGCTALDLIIVFNSGGRLERFCCEGFEGWEYKPPLKRANKTKKITNLFDCGGTLREASSSERGS